MGPVIWKVVTTVLALIAVYRASRFVSRRLQRYLTARKERKLAAMRYDALLSNNSSDNALVHQKQICWVCSAEGGDLYDSANKRWTHTGCITRLLLEGKL